jgi:hypothetical protein
MTSDQCLQFSPYYADIDVEDKAGRRKFLSAFQSAPQKLKTYLVSQEIVSYILLIAQRFGLSNYDTEMVSLLVRKIALAEIPLQKASELLSLETGLEDIISKDIISTILRDTLAPVIEEVKNMYKKEEKQTPSPVLNTPQQLNPKNVVNLRK